MKSILGIAVVMALLFFSCKEKDPLPNPFEYAIYQPPVEDSLANLLDPVSIEGLHQTIFAPTCANSGCHDGTFEPDFRTIESAYNSLVFQKLIKNNPANDFTYRVLPGNADQSILYQRITTDIDGISGIMPLITDPGSDWPSNKETYINNIKTWINNGALDMFGNAPVEGNFLPQVEGVIAFADGSSTELARAPGRAELEVPSGTSSLEIWFSLSDVETSIQDLTGGVVKFSERLNDYTVFEEESLAISGSAKSGQLFSGATGDFSHKLTLDVSGLTKDDTRYFRLYIEDGTNGVKEMPAYSSLLYIKKYFSLKII